MQDGVNISDRGCDVIWNLAGLGLDLVGEGKERIVVLIK